MRKILLSLLVIAFAMQLSAQDNERQQEAGITFWGLNNFGLTYRTGTESGMWRFGSVLINGTREKVSNSSFDLYEEKESTMGFGLRIGREQRSSIAEDFEFRYGADIGFNYHKFRQEVSNFNDYTRVILQPSFNLVLGLNYALSEKIIMGAEVMPSITYSRLKENGEPQATYIDYNISNGSAMLSLVYRF